MTQMEYIWKLYNYKWSTNKGYYFSIGISSLKEVTNYIKKKKKKKKLNNNDAKSKDIHK